MYIMNSGLTAQDGRGGSLGKSRKIRGGFMVLKFEWSTGAVLKSRRIKHSVEPLDKLE